MPTDQELNEYLFLRFPGIKDLLKKDIKTIDISDSDYPFNIEVSTSPHAKKIKFENSEIAIPKENRGSFNILLKPNNISNIKEAYALDALHFLPKNQEYRKMRNKYINDFRYSDHGLQQLAERAKLKAEHYKHLGSKRSWLQSGMDAFLRNLFVQGTSEEIESLGYNPNKEEELYYSPLMKPFVDQVSVLLLPTEVKKAGGNLNYLKLFK